MTNKNLHSFDDAVKETMQEINCEIMPSEQLITVTRTKMSQVKPRSKWIPRMQKATAVAACTLLVFIGAVNASPAFASAAAKVPIVRELVKAVAFDPSMKAAIEHDYVQLVKKSVSDNDYTLEVEYLVADPRNLTVYYKMDEITERNTASHKDYQFDFDLLDMDGNNLEGYGASWDYPISEEEKDALNAVKFNFTGEEILPTQVQLCLTVKEALPLSEEAQKQLDEAEQLTGIDRTIAHFEEPNPQYVEVARLIVPLTIDSENLFNVRTLELHQTVLLDGQKIIFDRVELYPTQIRVHWHADAANTHLISHLRMELQSKERGKWKGISNGVSGIGATDSEQRQTWLESSWFSKEEVYQLAVTEYALIPKEKQIITYEHRTGTIINLPEYAVLKEAVPSETGIYMEFEFRSTTNMVHGNVLEHEAINQNGSGSIFDEQDEKNGIYRFYNMFVVRGDSYTTEPICFKLTWAPPILMEQPVIVQLNETME